tara:strand:+ start:1150 stop:1269 length:120 start_codon:yes stop_codon:yes gene_type:complete
MAGDVLFDRDLHPYELRSVASKTKYILLLANPQGDSQVT